MTRQQLEVSGFCQGAENVWDGPRVAVDAARIAALREYPWLNRLPPHPPNRWYGPRCEQRVDYLLNASNTAAFQIRRHLLGGRENGQVRNLFREWTSRQRCRIKFRGGNEIHVLPVAQVDKLDSVYPENSAGPADINYE